MDVALLCPVSVGVVAWNGPDPTLTVVVKVTLTLPEDGAARLAPQQEPLTLDEQGTLGEPGDLDRASDFAPHKARADVLLAGHAYATSPMHVLSAGFAVDKLRKRFYALAAEPSAQTPLYPRYLRQTPEPEGAPVRVGARAIWTAEGAAASLVSRDGAPVGSFSRGFDYGLFNVAPPDQQIDLLGPTARLVLEGLVPGGDRRMVRLPGARPRVFSISPQSRSDPRPPEETSLRCDTLWIDAGHERCTLTFRGILGPTPSGAPPVLLVAMDFGSEHQSWATLRAELDRARWTRAATPESTRALAQHGAPSTPRPTARRSPPTLDLSLPTEPRGRPSSGTQLIDTRLLGAVLPFQQDHAPSAPSAPNAPAPTAPVASTPPPAPTGPPAIFPRRPAPTLVDDETSAPASVTRFAFAVPGAALPFKPVEEIAPPPAPPLARFPAPDELRLPPEPAREAPPTPRPEAPRPEAPRPEEALLPIETYAAIKAASWRGRALEEALRERAIDDIAWYTNERRLAAALAAEAAEGRSALSQELRRALRKAQAPAPPVEGALPAPEPLRRRVQQERAPRAARRVAARRAQ